MEEWKKYKLKDVATLTTGFPFDGQKYGKEGIRVVRGDNVTIGSLRWDSDKDKRWAETFERAAEYSLQAEDIVIGMDGSRVGRNRAQVKKEDLPLLIAQRVACVRHNELSLQSFLYYQIFSDSFEQYIKAVQTGTSIPHVSLKQIGDYPIVLPPLPKQKRIAEILKSLDDKIECNRRINDNLEQQAQALFKSWFVDFEPFRDKPFVESELGMIPEGWREGKVGDICKFENGFAFKSDTYSADGLYKIITIKNVQDGFLDTNDVNRISSIPAKMPEFCKLNVGDILLSLTGNVGRCCLVTEDDILLNQRVAKIRPCDDGNWGYVYSLFRTKDFKDRMISIARGTVQANLSPIETLKIPIVLPAVSMMKKYSMVTKDLYKKIISNIKQSLILAQLRDTLLPRLMSGELEIQDIEESL